MEQSYEKFYNSRFYKYFSMLIEEKKILEKNGISFLFIQTPLRQNIIGLSEFEKERLDNWRFDFNNITKEDCALIRQIYPKNVEIEYVQQLYDGSKVYEQDGVKYLADFQSKYVNVVAGKRITVGNPSAYTNKIYIYGQCTARGTGVEDGQTIPSYLQMKINEKYIDKYMVVNCATGCGSDIYDDIMHLRAERLKQGDIVIFCTNLEIVPTELFEKNSILYYDSSELFNRPHAYGEWFTDSTFHTTSSGNLGIAKFIYEVLEKKQMLNLFGMVENDYLEARLSDINIEQYEEEFNEYLLEIKKNKKTDGKKGCIVMNCNPFTFGHQYLIEYAAARVDYLYIFVVQEDKSFFKFVDRFELVKKGTMHIPNVIVIPSGKFIISAVTFPGYFNKDNCQEVLIDTSMDLKIFGKYIAPALDITVRFAGTEPTDVVTRKYNETMQELLPLYGIQFVEIERKQEEKCVISASNVRKYLQQNELHKLKMLVPKTTFDYLMEKYVNNTICEMEKAKCCGCEACANICPVGAIRMEMNEEGFNYPIIDIVKCIKCGKCKKICPIFEKREKKISKELQAYACFNIDEEIRSRSTSGGVFSLIAKYIIDDRHGVVYGARFNEKYGVCHDRATSLVEIERFRGSKYVQSSMSDIYKRVEDDLKLDRVVLFTGLPCHIEALLIYLGREYNNLYCIDMICYGIGSPGVWEQYLTHFHKDTIENIVFKDKINGWKNWKMKITENGNEYYYANRENLYMNSYLKRINIRKSCFDCGFKGLDRKSDITIADCWGIGEENRELNDDKGLSALLIHSDKGKMIFENIKQYMRYQRYDAYELMKGNWATFHSPKINEDRECFFKKMLECGIEYAMKKYCVFEKIGD